MRRDVLRESFTAPNAHLCVLRIEFLATTTVFALTARIGTQELRSAQLTYEPLLSRAAEIALPRQVLQILHLLVFSLW